MDLLGKQGEQALDGVENLSEKLHRIENHLEAVDSALQDFMDTSSKIREEESSLQESELQKIEEILREQAVDDKEIEHLRKKVKRLGKRQTEMNAKLEKIVDTGLLKTLDDLKSSITTANRASRKLRSDLNQLEERVDEIENETLLELNKREYDFQQKLDEKKFEEETDDIYNELKKLRASVHFLADELDKKDEVKIE